METEGGSKVAAAPVAPPPAASEATSEAKTTAKAKETQEEVEADAARFQALTDWLSENGAEFPNLYLKYYEVGYRGVHIKGPCSKNSLILTVPPKCLLTIEVAMDSPIGRALERKSCRLRTSHSYVAAFILEEKLEPESHWKPYIDILPKSYRHMPVMFTDEELAYLKGSLTLPEIKDRKKSYENDYNYICQNVPEFGQRHTLVDFIWARMVVLTRIFGITIRGVKTSGMVPMADMLNHKRPNETYWTFDDKRDSFTITTRREFNGGEQVFDSYGRKCNTRFFLNYGFVAHKNEGNKARFPLGLDQADPLFKRKLQLLRGGSRSHASSALKTIDIPTEYKKKLTKEAFAFCRLAMASEDELDLLTGGGLAFQLKHPNVQEIKPISLANEVAALAALAQAAKMSLAKFDDAIEVDQRLLAEAEERGFSYNEKNAIATRMFEKEVLHHYVTLAKLVPILTDETADSKQIMSNATNFVHEQPEWALQKKHTLEYLKEAMFPLIQKSLDVDRILQQFSTMHI